MNNFFQLPLFVPGQVLAPLVNALGHSKLWGGSEFDAARSSYEATVHQQVESITLRNNEPPYMDGTELDWTAAVFSLPQARSFIFDIARCVEATKIGRIVITKLKPFGEILPHIDQGEYVKAFHRYHLCLTGNRNTSFTCGEETVWMKPGQVWWMNNKVTHSVRNPGPKERIHLIVDLQS